MKMKRNKSYCFKCEAAINPYTSVFDLIRTKGEVTNVLYCPRCGAALYNEACTNILNECFKKLKTILKESKNREELSETILKSINEMMYNTMNEIKQEEE